MEDVEITLPDEDLLQLMIMAHEQDITFNQLCNNILRDWIKKLSIKHINVAELEVGDTLDIMINDIYENNVDYIILNEKNEEIAVIIPYKN